MGGLPDRLAQTFNIRPGEEPAALLLVAHSFFTGLSLVFLGTASYALFLTRYDVTILPAVYILSAAVNIGLGYAYSRLEERLSFANLLRFTLSAALLTVGLFYLFLKLIDAAWTVMAFAVCYNVLAVFMGLVFWGMASRLFNVRQGKRLFGLIGAGEIIAGIIGGFSVPVLVSFIKTANLLPLSAIGIAGCLCVLTYIIRTFRAQLEIPEEKEEDNDKKGLADMLKNRYLVMVLCVNGLSVFAYYVVDYVFYNQLDGHFPTETRIAGFLGVYFAVFRIISLVSNTFLSGRLINRFGLSIGLLTFPMLLAVGAGVATTAHVVAGSAALFFWIIVCMKVFDEVVRYSIEDPTIRILCQPVPGAMRLKTLTLLETAVEPVASAFMGGLLILLTNALSFKAVHIILMFFVILAGWIALSFFLKREYTAALMNALSWRKLKARSLSIEDASSISVLQKGLKSAVPGEVIYCLNMLEEIEHEALDGFLIDLLNHPEARVRRHVLDRIGRHGVTAALERVTGMLKKESAPDVTGAALKTLCMIAETDAFDQVFPYMTHKDLEIRKGAMVGLLTNAGIDGLLSAGPQLNTLLDSSDPVERRFAAQVLGEVGIATFYRPLLKLLRDSDMGVRKAAVIAAGHLKNTRLIPLLLENFTVPAVGNAAAGAVIAFGPPAVSELEDAFDRDRQSRQARIRIIRVIGKIGGEKAVAVLKKKIDYPDEDIRTHILAALVACKYQVSVREIPTIQERIRNEAEDAAWTISVMVDIGASEHTRLLLDAMKTDLEKNKRRIFLLLAVMYPENAILQARTNLASNSPEKRAYALEMLDNIVSQEIKALVFPLLENITPSQRHARLISFFPQQRMSRHERLKEILSRSHHWISSWSKACTLYTIGKIATSEFYDVVVSALSDSDVIVRETAVWAMGCLNPDDLIERLSDLKNDESARVARIARFVINAVGFASIPMGKGYLTRSGRYTIELFSGILLDEGERRARRRRAASILARFQGAGACAALMEGLTIGDKTIRSAVLDALVKGGYDIEPKYKTELGKLLHIELADARQVLSSIAALSAVDHSRRLVSALAQELDWNRKRILSTLVLIGDGASDVKPLFYWQIHQQGRGTPDGVWEAFEAMLQNLSDQNVKEKIFALFKHRDPDRLAGLWRLKQTETDASIESHLKRIAFDSSAFSLSWSRLCALEMIVQMNLTSCTPQIIERLGDIRDIMRATAAWALFKLDPEAYANYELKLKNDLSPLVSRTARQLSAERATV